MRGSTGLLRNSAKNSAGDSGGAKKSLLGKFGDFKSLLPSKPAKAAKK